MNRRNGVRPSHTIAGHATASVAQDCVDDLAYDVGAGILAALWGTELSFLLRSGKCPDRNRALARESADFFVGGDRITFVPDHLRRRFCGRIIDGTARRRRHGIYVRSGRASDDSPAQLVSCGYSAAAVVGDLATGIRPARVEGSDTDDVGRGAHQLFLAAWARCELGARTFLSRAARDAGVGLSTHLSDRGSGIRLLSDALVSGLAQSPMGRTTQGEVEHQRLERPEPLGARLLLSAISVALRRSLRRSAGRRGRNASAAHVERDRGRSATAAAGNGKGYGTAVSLRCGRTEGHAEFAA
jgi:hypothetical protein